MSHGCCRIATGALAACLLLLGAPAPLAMGQIDPAVRDRVVPAAVAIAILVTVTDEDGSRTDYVPVGSGTIVSASGLILTNWHVVDLAAAQAQLDRWVERASAGDGVSFELDETRLLVLRSDRARPPEPGFTAVVVAWDEELDLAVLGITGDATGDPVYAATLDLPFVPIGNSDDVRLGDPVDVLGYPAAGGDSLTYTTGVVSGFNFNDGDDSPSWITTDATLTGGSSGGAALDRDGRLIGVPTQGSELECRPGDTNGDGAFDAGDLGCIPVGGSIGQLRPINLAQSVLAKAGFVASEDPVAPAAQDSPTAASDTDSSPGAPEAVLSATDETAFGFADGFDQSFPGDNFDDSLIARACHGLPVGRSVIR